MSTLDKRRESRRNARELLAEQIAALGVTVHDQPQVDRWMEDMRRGIMPDSWRITRFLREGKAPLEWEIFDFDSFNDSLEIYREYGGAPPHSVVQEARSIKSALPHVELQVYGTRIDPVLAIKDGAATVFVRAWLRGRIVF